MKLGFTNSSNGWVQYTYTDNTYRLNYNGAGNDEVTMDTSGNFTIGAGNLVMGTAGESAGIDFSATGNAGGMGNNYILFGWFVNSSLRRTRNNL